MKMLFDTKKFWKLALRWYETSADVHENESAKIEDFINASILEAVEKFAREIKHKMYEPDFKSTVSGYLKVPNKEWNDLIDARLANLKSQTEQCYWCGELNCKKDHKAEFDKFRKSQTEGK